MKKLLYNLLAASLLAVSVTSCNSDFMETSPTDKIDSGQVIETMDNLVTLLSGAHRNLYGYYGYDKPGESGMNMERDILAEDVVMPNRGNGWFVNEYAWLRHIDPDSDLSAFGFSYYYGMISTANTLLSNVDNIPGDEGLRNQIKGEAYVFRAFGHFQWYSCTVSVTRKERTTPSWVWLVLPNRPWSIRLGTRWRKYINW